MLSIKDDIDYRIVYMEQRKIEERLKDVYIAKSTQKKPPTFGGILEELVDIEAALFVRHNREIDFLDFTDEEIEGLIRDVDLEIPEAIAAVLERMDMRFIEMFAKDLFLMLLANNYVFFEQDRFDRNQFSVYHEPIQSIW